MELAAVLRWLLLLPLESWGFEHEPDYERFTAYSVAMLHTLMLAMPEAGNGDPVAARARSPLPRLRHDSPVGFGREAREGEGG